MKILLVGDLNEYGRSFQRFRALKELGHEVSSLSYVPIGYKPGISRPVSIIDRIAHKLRHPLDRMHINKNILMELKSKKFDFLWIEKGLMIRPFTLKQAKKLQPALKIVSYTEDDMFARHNQSAYYRACLPLYDVVFTTKSYNCNPDELSALGAKKVVFVDKAYDKHTHRPLPITDEDRERLGADVGFIGTFEQDRADKMFFLAKNGIIVRIWGNGWSSWANNHLNLRVENRPIYKDDYIKAICSTKINLCFLRKINRDLQTGRTMEIPACGAFMLAEQTGEHLRLFEKGKEAVYFASNKELLGKVRYYLEHEDERQAIARAGRQRCLESEYSHHERLRFMLGKVKNV